MCIGDAPYLLLWQGNTHQAMWILTRWQLQLLHHKCNFLEERGRLHFHFTFSPYTQTYYNH